jgi:segregation and condensation protein B
MSEPNDNSPVSAPPTPEAHGNREEKGSSEHARASAAPTAEETAVDRDDHGRVRAIIEALLFASDDPLDRSALEESLPDIDPEAIKRALENLRLEFSGTHRGIHLVEVAGGFQLRTNADFKERILGMYEAKPRKLSRAAMETLAIIAYQQPLTRADVEEIRGVDSSGVIRTLEDYGLAQTIGRLDDLGRPHIYGTTPRFLEFFGLESLTDLPTLDASELEAIQEMYAEELAEAKEADRPEGLASDVADASDVEE